MTTLGKLNQVTPRTIWKHEAHDFTKWLAREENIQLLADELDIKLDNVVCEDRAGSFFVDITADLEGTENKVIIENQLETTDHDHLGKLLTYASSFDASIIIWIATDYNPKHKQAIDWFNENMPNDISFFLIRLEVWQIDDSNPAPKFHVISRPNEWAKLVKQASGSNRSLSEYKLMQMEFWQGFKEYASENATKVNITHQAAPNNYMDVSIGSSRAHICMRVKHNENIYGPEIYINDDQELYTRLHEQKDVIEAALGYPLGWNNREDVAYSNITDYENLDLQNRETWQYCYEDLLKRTEKFAEVFRPIIVL